MCDCTNNPQHNDIIMCTSFKYDSVYSYLYGWNDQIHDIVFDVSCAVRTNPGQEFYRPRRAVLLRRNIKTVKNFVRHKKMFVSNIVYFNNIPICGYNNNTV